MKFLFDTKEYNLEANKCSAFLNDDEKPVTGLDVYDVLNILENNDKVDFDRQYYQEACPKCLYGVKEKEKFFPFLEYYFYILTKNQKYVVSDISKEYEDLSFNKLYKKGEVDDSYIVCIIICEHCGEYLIQIENCAV